MAYSDNFTGVVLDTAKWTDGSTGTGRITQNGNVTLDNSSSSNGLAQITSAAFHSLTANPASIHYITRTAGLQYDFMVIDASGNGYALSVSFSGQLWMQTVSGGSPGGALDSAAFNGTTMAYLRLRDDGTTIHWEYSADGSSWTDWKSQARTVGIDHTQMKVRLRADNTGTGSVSSVTWDDFAWGSGVVAPTAGFTASCPLKLVTITDTSVAGTNPITSKTYDYDHGGAGSSPGDTLTTHTYSVGGTYTIRQTVSDGTLSDTEDASVTTKTRYTYSVVTVPGGRSASATADRPDA
jgi:hypothetical protein